MPSKNPLIMPHTNCQSKSTTAKTPKLRRSPTQAANLDEVLANHRKLLERNAYFRRFGYDLEVSIKFILAQALPLGGAVLEIGTGKGRFLAGFSPRGFQIMDHAHRAEGRIHSRANHSFGNLQRFLRGRGWATRWRKGCFQEVLIAWRKDVVLNQNCSRDEQTTAHHQLREGGKAT